MKIFKFPAPRFSDADTWYVTEDEWQVVLDTFEGHVDAMEVGEKLSFEVELIEMTPEEWESFQEDFIE